MNKQDFLELIEKAFLREAMKKLVFSKPSKGEIKKISCRLCAHRGRRILAMEYFLPGDTVSQKNVGENEIKSTLMPLFDTFMQTNLYTTLGDAEYKAKGEREVFLGADKLRKKLLGEAPTFERAIEELDKKKNYLLSGSEDFLIRLGISAKDGRVHDKRQGKFRQINRFLEHIEDVYSTLPEDGPITVYDLCSGKSYLGFAVYHYLTAIKGREVLMHSVDLKRDVVLWCEGLARELGFSGMSFAVEDIRTLTAEKRPDMVISLHACDVATDIVINSAIRLGARVILSTPCCHRYLNSKINAGELSFVTDYPQLRNKLCEAFTDAIRLARLKAAGYTVSALELTDPDNTPKNTLLRAIKRKSFTEKERAALTEEYEKILEFILGEDKESYLKDL